MAALEQAKQRVEAADDIVPATVTDAFGNECLVGLNSLETQEYRLLQKIALHGDDVSFLRYIELGDRHEAEIIRLRKQAGAAR